MKIAVLAQSLPPSQSVLAIMLNRLLQGIPADSYCLLSVEKHGAGADGGMPPSALPGRYHYLNPILGFGWPLFLDSLYWAVAIRVYIVIRWRAQQITKILKEENCDAILAFTADFHDLPAAYLASKWTGLPLILYLFDDYAYQWTGAYRKIALQFEPILMKHAKKVIVTNERMKGEYLRRYARETFVLHNPSPLYDLQELTGTGDYFNSAEVNIVYAGGIYHAHYDAFQNLIAAIKKLNRPDIKLHIYGTQSEAILEQHGIAGSMVILHGRIDPAEVPRVLRQATILFLPLAFRSEIHEVIRTASPGKMGEYLSVAMPILVHAPEDSFVSWYFNAYQCGIVVDRCNTDQLAGSLLQLIEDRDLRSRLSRNARERACTDFDQHGIQERFVQFMEKAVHER